MGIAKQYKAVSPETTVQRIKLLLGNVGIKVKEETRSLKNLVFSARITIVNGRIADLDLGSNGKGLTPEYALASGYAELMERLQTRLLYDDLLMLPPSATRKILGASFYRCAPEEVPHRAEWRFFPKQGVGARLRVGRTAYAEMIALRSGKSEMVPLELMRYMTGSTGACAGNTRDEAIVQGICEILERHALQKVFLTGDEGLPTIPTRMLSGLPAWSRLRELARVQGLNFAVKDCSFGTGMPILGLLVWNDTSYQFRLGVATSPDVALSRCFTEIFQGYTGNECLLSREPKLMVASPVNYQKAKVNGTGHLPIGIFAEQREATLENFKPFEGEDIEGDYKVLTEALLSAGYEIYIRDCSFLGFPSYYIYIPGLSDIEPKLLDFQKRIDTCMRLTRRANSQRRPAYNAAYLPKRYPPALYAFALSLKKKDYISAHRHFESLLGRQLPRTPYNEATMEFLCLKVKGMQIGCIKAKLKERYGDLIATKILFEFGPNANTSAIFKLPTCFNCSGCPTEATCALNDIAKIDKVVQDRYREYYLRSARLMH